MKRSRTAVLVTALTVVLTTVLAITAIGTRAWAAETPAPKETGLVGSWTGGTDDGAESMEWVAIHTPGTNPTGGQMLMNWVYVRSNLLGSASHLTPGHGVWAQTGRGQYRYTWYAYGMGEIEGNPVRYYTVRVTGLATMMDSDNVSITYKYEVFEGGVAPQDMPGATLLYSTSGTARETRLTLATP